MKIDHTLAATLLIGLTNGSLQYPRHITQNNRMHTDRAPRGSPQEAERILDAQLKRERKALRRAKGAK